MRSSKNKIGIINYVIPTAHSNNNFTSSLKHIIKFQYQWDYTIN